MTPDFATTTMTQRAFAWTIIAAGLVLAGVATWLGLSYLRDANSLRSEAQAVTAMGRAIGRKVELLNAWVYRNKGFEKNPRYFWIRRLGPTPMDVLDGGGDCADKSRLLAAMLRELGIEASLAMIYPCPDCAPVHTVVLARSELGWIVADPVYDLTFPDGAGGYRTLNTLISSDDVLTERLSQLRMERGPDDKINYYDSTTHHYRYIRTINWNKNWLLRSVAAMLEFLHYEPRTLPRPQILEDPKYAMVWLSSGLSLTLVCFGALFLLQSARTSQRARQSLARRPTEQDRAHE